MSNLHVIVGLGATGFSCARYLKAQGIAIAITDSRTNPPYLADWQKIYPDVPVSLGELDQALISKASTIVLSPGIALQEPAIKAAIAHGIPVIGDVELFARAQAAKAKVIAITGTNAKSTVTTLVAKMTEAARLKTRVGGNLGTPALDLLQGEIPDVYVLELSSFQLETTESLQPSVATVLNVTPDHMDRYATFADYQAAKLRIYHHAQNIIYNADDPLTFCDDKKVRQFAFTLQVPQKEQFGLLSVKGQTFLAFGDKPLLAVNELPIRGKHYQANALASLAIGHAFGLSLAPMLQVLREFKGLPHRCEMVRKRAGIAWYNDSKGTNVGATEAAIKGLGPDIKGKLILIAGGVGKNADFTSLVPVIQQYTRHVVLIGEAANDIAAVIAGSVPVSFATSMEEAVQLAALAAKKDDSVLLSPACASFDMFNNYAHRGEVFAEIVTSL